MNDGAEILVFVCRNDGSQPTEERVRECAARFTGRGDPLGWRVERDARGKPYFPDHPEICFSVSHSGEYWMCAVARQPVGLDLQREQKARAAAISRRFFHPEEDAYLKATGYRDFFEIWAAKESCVKYTGQGIAGSFGGFSVLSNGKIARGIGGACLRRLPFREGWSLYLCSREDTPARVVEL